MTRARLLTVEAGGPLHHADFGGGGPEVVLVHGLGGSHVNWLAVGERLAARARVRALDLPGFGLTPPGAGPVTVARCRDALGRFLGALGPGPFVLVGHSLGALVSILEAEARPARIAGLVLVAPVIPGLAGRVDAGVTAAFAPYFVPGLAERWQRHRRARLGPEGLVREMIELAARDPATVAPAIVEEHDEMARRRAALPWADTAFAQAARSLLLLLVLRRRRLERALAAVRAPVLAIAGAHDRLVPPFAVRAALRPYPTWRIGVLPDAGHVPHLEAPAPLAAAIETWLTQRDRIPPTNLA